MKLGSLFDGSGGFDFAGQICGIEPVWASEIEPFPIAVTTKRFPNMRHLGDVTKINGAEIEPVDIITFGSPCQDLSVAGKRAGLDGARSGLFSEAIRIIKEMREATNGNYPTFAIWENVPGAFSSNGGEDFRIVLESFCKVIDKDADVPEPPKGKWSYAGEILGDWYSVAWRVLDAQYWGVPQRRRRIFLVADFRGGRAGKILFERSGLQRSFKQSREAWKEPSRSFAFGSDDTGRIPNGKDIRVIPLECNPSDARMKISPKEISQTLKERMGTGGNNVPLMLILCNWDGSQTVPTLTARNAGGAQRMPDKDNFQAVVVGEVAGTLDSSYYKGCGERNGTEREIVLMYALGLDRASYNQGQNALYDFAVEEERAPTVIAKGLGLVFAVYCRNGEINEKNGTVTSASSHNIENNNVILLPISLKLRRLTPTECARLQGMPDWWTADVPHSDTNEYKMWGNGMALPCVLYVMEGVAKELEEQEHGRA